MGRVCPPEEASLFMGILAKEEAVFRKARSLLEERWGSISLEWGPHPFSQYTDYYHPEMGKPLQRYFLGFERLIPPDLLASVKRETQRLEEEFLQREGEPSGRRSANIDPGLLQLPRVILASTKDHAHRLYLGDGIYGELTLLYEGGEWKALPWTYPDYRSKGYHSFFSRLREFHRRALRRANP